MRFQILQAIFHSKQMAQGVMSDQKFCVRYDGLGGGLSRDGDDKARAFEHRETRFDQSSRWDKGGARQSPTKVVLHTLNYALEPRLALAPANYFGRKAFLFSFFSSSCSYW